MSNITDQQENEKRPMPLRKGNFVPMAAAGVLIVLGFVLMLGAGSTDIFSTRRIVVGPCLAFIGFVAMAAAIIIPFRKS